LTVTLGFLAGGVDEDLVAFDGVVELKMRELVEVDVSRRSRSLLANTVLTNK
jgi:hypothetical protein